MPKMRYLRIVAAFFTGVVLVVLSSNNLNGQTFDTISNWESIQPDWYVSTGGSAIVNNPEPDEINASERCFKVVTSQGSYDYMKLVLANPVDFDQFPHYRIKVLPPLSGGKVTLKFENENNTYAHELVESTVGGRWNDLEFDFSGFYYNNLTRMVIFFDFEGSSAGKLWYFDDVLKEIPLSPDFESNLPIVVINTNGVPVPDDPKITAHMGIIDNGPNEVNSLGDPFNSYDGFIGIEVRGQSSQMFPKKSYGIETRDATGDDLDAMVLGMPSESDWVLYAPYTDKSMLRNVVTFAMGHQMSVYCTRTVFCELVLNNDYKGVYVMMEKIKKDENRLDIASLKPDEISGNDLTGGYIIKVDKIDPGFTYGVHGWKSNPVPPYPNAMDITFQYNYPDPDDIVSQQRNYIKDFVTNAENTLASNGFASPSTGYHNYFDALSFVDFMLLCEISKEVDKYRYSTYFYKEKDSDGGKLFAGPAWDFNLGYGNVDYWPPGVDFTGWLYSMVESHDYSIMFWWKRLMEDAYFRNLAKTRWTYLRQHKLTNTSMYGVIDSLVTLVDAAKTRNYERWDILGKYVWPNYDWYDNSYEDEVSYFEDYLFNRLNWMDYNMPGNILHPGAGISAEANRIRLLLYGDYFVGDDLNTNDFTLNNASAELSIQSVQYLSPSECELVLSDNVAGQLDVSVTVDHNAINYWLDIESNKLESAGMNSLLDKLPEIVVYANDYQIRVVCDKPEHLPRSAEIFHVSGQRIDLIELEMKAENNVPLRLNQGVYLIVFDVGDKKVVKKFSVIRL